jgi:hypothetical protein
MSPLIRAPIGWNQRDYDALEDGCFVPRNLPMWQMVALENHPFRNSSSWLVLRRGAVGLRVRAATPKW